jgi:hypothetical protein
MPANPTYLPLLNLLLRRRAVISDHAWRDRDGPSHLAGLQQVCEAIMAEQERLFAAGLPPRLRHYLTQCSYDKATSWIESDGHGESL